jgi:hypothetical protein
MTETGTELARPEDLTYEAMAKASGQGKPDFVSLPRLRINRLHEHPTKDVALPAGAFMVTLGDKTYYSPKLGPVHFRPYINTFRNEVFDENYDNGSDKPKGKVVNWTMYIRNWQEEMLDITGGVRCGKIPRKSLDKASPEQQAKSKKVQAYRCVFGEVRIPDATTLDENGVLVDAGELNEWTPCLWRMRGNNYMPFQEEVLDILDNRKQLMSTVELVATNVKKSNADNVWYVTGFKFDPTQTLPLDDHALEMFKLFEETIRADNKAVAKKHTDALRGVHTEEDEADEKNMKSLESDFDEAEANSEDTPKPDLDDEIPF